MQCYIFSSYVCAYPVKLVLLLEVLGNEVDSDDSLHDSRRQDAVSPHRRHVEICPVVVILMGNEPLRSPVVCPPLSIADTPCAAIGVTDLDAIVCPDGNALKLVLAFVLRTLHEQKTRQDVQEQLSDPGRHDVRRRGPEVDVKDENSHDDGTGDEYHREEEVLADQRSGEGRRRVDLGNEKEEDVERIKNRNGHRYLLTRVGRYEEDEESDNADGNARKDEVDRVVERLSPHRYVELDVWIGFRTTRVVLEVLLCRYGQQIPLCTSRVVR